MSDSNLDLQTPFATFLAAPVSDGTWSDVLVSLKSDDPGKETAATAIEFAGGQLWANQIDNMFNQSYRVFQGNKFFPVDTTDATPDSTSTIDTLTADGDAAYVRVTIIARDPGSPAFVLEQHLGGTFYRSGGAVLVLNPILTAPALVGFTTAIAAIIVTGDVVAVEVTGEAATNITWSVTVDESRRLA